MIHHLRGAVVERYPTHVVIEAGGVGYLVHIPLSTYERIPAPHGECLLLVHHHFYEEGQLLIGFARAPERDMFRLLITIRGIGPRLAMSVLSGLPLNALRDAIAKGDVRALSRIRGVGKKTAERIVLELRDRLGLVAASGDGPLAAGAGTMLLSQPAQDAVLALVTLGYKQADAQRAVAEVTAGQPGADARVEVDQIVRDSLKRLL